MKTNGRPDWDTYYMLICNMVATRATCDRGKELIFDKGRKGAGAVIVKDNRIISTGYNGSPEGFDHCDNVGHMMRDGHCQAVLHAEENAILQCAKLGISCKGAKIYCTTQPCYECCKKIVQTGIWCVVYYYEYNNPDCEKILEKADIGVVKWSPPKNLEL